ncbi:MAG: leucine-rich repeat domain-containing protein [Alistipes sp.]|nr:leucine-rich repeat domain-containing protein [Alistipes sp.]
MRNLYNIIFITVWCVIVSVCVGCESVDIDDSVNGADGTEDAGGSETSKIHLCSNWGMTKEQVKSEMTGYALDKEDEAFLCFSSDNAAYIISYEFYEAGLCASLLMAKTDVTSDSAMLQFVSDYTEIGFVEPRMVYLNEKKSSVATYNTEIIDNIEYKTLGLTRLDMESPRNVLCYTTTDDRAITPNVSSPFNVVQILSNTYSNGIGVIVCDGDITSIASDAFKGCTKLKSITLPSGLTLIQNKAFADCTSLENVAIHDGITSLGYGIFDNCTSLTDVHVDISNLADYCVENHTRKFVGNRHLYINGLEITELVIPDSVTEIGECAFYECSGLTSVTIPDSVTSIGDYAFNRCYSLTGITIPNSVTMIGSGAFVLCTSLVDMTIPGSVSTIGSFAFKSCTSLTNVTICDGVTSIGGGAFDGCSNLVSINIPDSVTILEGALFEDCSSLPIEGKIRYADVYLAEAIDENMVTCDIKDGTRFVGGYAFYINKCTKLTTVTIPDSVISIGYWAFIGCSSLKEVYCKATTPPIGSPAMFNSNASDRKIYVPRASVDAYKSAQYWSAYADSIVGYDF